MMSPRKNKEVQVQEMADEAIDPGTENGIPPGLSAEERATADREDDLEKESGGQDAPAEGDNGQDELAALRKEKEELFDRLARMQAEFENSRKRLTEQNRRERQLLMADVIKQFITVYEEFFTSTQVDIEKGLELARYHEGVTKVFQKFDRVMKDQGLAVLGKPGEAFDPLFHQALLTVPTQNKEIDQTVERVLSRGFKVNDHLIRPAMVSLYSFAPEAE